jgi:glycosyltransferase involved in cell wall biosynthesis
MSLISIVTPCFNEQDNVEEVYRQTKAVFATMPDLRYEHIFIDNCSQDNTVMILKRIAMTDKNVKIIVNSRNFGHVRSPYYALLQSKGDAAIFLAADLQDPPALIKEFIAKWQQGYKIVVGVKQKSRESALMFAVRRMFYYLLKNFSEVELISNFMGFGLYDKRVVDILRDIDDPYPYLRGLICEIGFERADVPYTQPARLRGKAKSNFYVLYDLAMLGFVKHSKLPLRLASFLGFGTSFFSILCGLGYLVYKLVFWNTFQVGMAPLVIGIFFLGGVQLFFLGVIGEYIASIHTQVMKRPLVIEKERVNF